LVVAAGWPLPNERHMCHLETSGFNMTALQLGLDFVFFVVRLGISKSRVRHKITVRGFRCSFRTDNRLKCINNDRVELLELICRTNIKHDVTIPEPPRTELEFR